MPHDSHDVFAWLSDKEKKALLPAGSLPEYRNDRSGRSATTRSSSVPRMSAARADGPIRSTPPRAT